ncbi:PP2C family protein-serine/threonine phosphatase [Pollutibacter soli]|uniref:PP2C family protein-serine/threonine phosphatase n=1 Tax=Pollutibacter soli TaxID=3034157 RepID=UPI003013DD6C
MHFNGNTHPGKRRKENQDAYGCKLLWDRDKVLLIVVDGVGGYAGGERAAEIARESIEEYMISPKGDLLTMLREAVLHANNRIFEERKINPEFFEMCCVLTAVVTDMHAGCFHYVHVGDTRLYRFRNGSLQKITRDHSFVGIREDAGELTEAEAMKHPQRNEILREAGSTIHRMDDEDFLDYGSGDFIYGDQLLLCSDGLTDMLPASQITEVLNTHRPVGEKVNELIQKANEMGGFDNITVVMIRHNRKTEKKQMPKPPADEANKKEKFTEITENENKSVLSKFSMKRILLRSALLLIFFAGTSWYFFAFEEEPEQAVITLPHQEIKVRDSVRENMLYTIRSSHPALPGPVDSMRSDTIRISETKHLVDLQKQADSSNVLLVVVPAKAKPKFPAASVSANEADSGSVVTVKNIHFHDFETAIQLSVPVTIQLENVLFDNIANPIKNNRPGTKNKQLLLTLSNP